ncbi:anti-repressor SinI family protein [Metabacillus halosaccharovorans]
MTTQNLDEEWEVLIQEALQLGITSEEIKSFLNSYINTSNS